MKKRKTKKWRLWTFGAMAILLLAAPVLRAQETVPVGETWDINYAVNGLLFVNGTANLRSGAFASSVYVQYEGRLNIYSGTVDLLISVSRETLGTTVYGTDFAVDSGTIDSDGNWTPSLMGTLTGKYEDGTDINLWFLSDTSIKLVDIENEENNDELTIDIKPGSDENSINLKSRGVVPVAVLTTDEFDAGTLVPDYSISFAGASPVHTTLCDVDGDGEMDMLFHFRTQELIKSVDNPEGLDENSTEAELTGTLTCAITSTRSSSSTAGDTVEGIDKVKIKSSKKK